ncbi:hypothetical protein D6833_00470 [Candidatus Parcubacteria bacterium]|nr:MAG: hypothetical protein D6833_00470 [Candidatus Parcubacteria bacterium]
MKRLQGFLLLGTVFLMFSCGGDGSNPSGPGPSTSFSLADLQGTWTGEAKNADNTVSLNLTCDTAGEVSGSGVDCTWAIDSQGKVTGSGSFTFVAGSSLIVASASWHLQLDNNKTSLSGTFNVAYPTLHDLEVTLNKQ